MAMMCVMNPFVILHAIIMFLAFSNPGLAWVVIDRVGDINLLGPLTVDPGPLQESSLTFRKGGLSSGT